MSGRLPKPYPSFRARTNLVLRHPVVPRAVARGRLSGDALERWAGEVLGVDVEPLELERILRRTVEFQKGISNLETLVGRSLEPLPTVSLEEES